MTQPVASALFLALCLGACSSAGGSDDTTSAEDTANADAGVVDDAEDGDDAGLLDVAGAGDDANAAPDTDAGPDAGPGNDVEIHDVDAALHDADASTADADADAEADDGDAETEDGDAETEDGDTETGDTDTETEPDADTDTETEPDTETDTEPDTDTDAADAVLPPATPTPVASLPAAPLTDISATLPLDPAWTWFPCAGVGFVDGDDTPDLVLIGTKSFNDPIVASTFLLGPGKEGLGKVAHETTINSALLFPTGGCSLVDTDGDKDDDLLLLGSSGVLLYRNDGGTFVLDPNALPDLPGTKAQTISAADFDGDGDVDLFVGSGVSPLPCDGYTCAYDGPVFDCFFSAAATPKNKPQDRLLLQTSPGTFVDGTWGWDVPKTNMVTRAVALDVDEDGWMDVLIGNDFEHEKVLRNVGGQLYVPWVPQGLGHYGHGMGWGVGDLDGDGDLDLVHADGGPTPVYLRDGSAAAPPAGDPSYTPLPPSHPLTAWTFSTSVWSPLLADLNLDGHLDIFLGVAMEWAGIDPLTLDDCALDPKTHSSSDLLVLATGADAATTAGWQATKSPASQCGMWGTLAESLVDVDGDGDLDIVQVEPNCSFDGTFQVLRNDTAGLGDVSGQVVRVRLVGPPGNRDGFGARLTATRAGMPVVRQLANEVGPGSTAARVLHLGLGAAQQLDDVVVTWPGGVKQSVGVLQPGPVHLLASP